MKKLSTVAAVLATLAFSSGAAQAASTYTADKAHSSVGFSVRHMMTQVRGSFGDFTGTIVKDDANLAGASVEFKIQATSVDTANEMRDKHLRTEDFFFVEKFPEITFKSTKIEKVSDTEYKATGEFTMRGVTKVLTLPVRLRTATRSGVFAYSGLSGSHHEASPLRHRRRPFTHLAHLRGETGEGGSEERRGAARQRDVRRSRPALDRAGFHLRADR